MKQYQLKIKLLSDTTFGRGDGVAGIIDQEVEHDACGLPYLRGRTLKGVLSEECDNLIYTLANNQSANNQSYWREVANKLFGISGSGLDIIAAVHIGDAQLPQELRNAVDYELQQKQFTPQQILDSLTTIRKQTSIDNQTGVADKGSLRSARVVLRDLEFTSNLFFEAKTVDENMLALLAVGALALRHLGSGRNRGRGHVQCTLHDANGNDITQSYIYKFGLEEKSA